MNAALIQSKINFGYGKTATYLGVSCNWYRPTYAQETGTVFIAPSTLQGTVMVYFDSKANFQAQVPESFAHPMSYLAFDRTNFLQGDMIADPTGRVFFINDIQPMAPTGAIECNALASVYRPGQDQTPGTNYYGGNPTGLGAELYNNCPCSILQGTKGEADNSGVVNEGRQPWVSIILPSVAGNNLWVGDMLIDDQDRRYQLSSIETTQLGVRCTAQYSGT